MHQRIAMHLPDLVQSRQYLRIGIFLSEMINIPAPIPRLHFGRVADDNGVILPDQSLRRSEHVERGSSRQIKS